MGANSNFCTWNPLGAHGGGTTDFGTLSGGNLLCTLGDTVFGNFGVTSGKWYWEWCLTGSAWDGGPGWANQQVNTQAELGYNSPSSATGAQMVYMYCSSGSTNWHIISDAPKGASSGTTVDYSTAISQDDIIGICADFDNDKWYMSINGSFTNMRSSQDPATGTNPLCSKSGEGGTVTIARTAGYVWYPAIGNWAAASRASTVNFGQDSTFGGEITAGGNADGNGFGDFKYSPPSGFLALCSGNLPISDDIDPAQTDDDYAGGKLFNTIIYTGTGSSNALTGLGFQPDLVWIKRRNGSGDHKLTDSSRGVTKSIEANTNDAEATDTNGLTAFGSDGFTVGSDAAYNNSSDTYVAWAWRANAGTTASNSEGNITATVQANTKAGFSIITYTGSGGTVSGANPTFGHGLESAPDFLIFKCRSDGSSNWIVWHQGLGGANKYMSLNATTAVATDTAWLSNTAPSSTLITTDNGGWGAVNGSSRTNVCYAWHNVDGMQRFGSYVGNGDANGPFVYTGFRPRFLIIKARDSGQTWFMYDTERSTSNPVNRYLYGQRDLTEDTAGSIDIDFTASGFKVRNSRSDTNTSGDTYIYMSWGDVPFKYNNTF